MSVDKNKNILVIDDCESNLILIQLILETQGYRVKSASSGRDGLAEINKTCPDLIVLDLMMPDLSGLEVIQCLKANHNLSHIPILLLTANSNFRKEEAVDADELCYKPFDLEDLLAKIKSLLLCRENIKSSTLIVDIGEDDPLIKENKQLQSSLSQEHSVWEILQQQGYEIGGSYSNSPVFAK